MSEKRREVRHPARIVARVVRRNEATEYLTNDVSFRGAFIRTDAPPALRQLVRVTLVLPDGALVSGHAMVVHVVAPGEKDPQGGNVPGMGLQFWGPVENGKAWEQFIHEVRKREKAGRATSQKHDKVRRASERFKLTIEVVLDGHTLTTRDVSENGMAVRCEHAMPIGVRATLEIRAPKETVALDVVVRRRIDEPSFRGLGVEFVDLTPEKRAALLTLVRSHTPPEDAVFIAPGDPKLH